MFIKKFFKKQKRIGGGEECEVSKDRSRTYKLVKCREIISKRKKKIDIQSDTHNYQKPWDARHTYQRTVPETEVMLPEKAFKTGRMKFLP